MREAGWPRTKFGQRWLLWTWRHPRAYLWAGLAFVVAVLAAVVVLMLSYDAGSRSAWLVLAVVGAVFVAMVVAENAEARELASVAGTRPTAGSTWWARHRSWAYPAVAGLYGAAITMLIWLPLFDGQDPWVQGLLTAWLVAPLYAFVFARRRRGQRDFARWWAAYGAPPPPAEHDAASAVTGSRRGMRGGAP